MSKIRIALLLACLVTTAVKMSAQAYRLEDPTMESETVRPANDATNPCISALEYAEIALRCSANRRIYGIPLLFESTAKITTTLLEWPLKPAAGLHDCSYYHIGAYVDQNTATGQIQDWNCGTNTYDGHKGTDIATWPFNFYKMDNDLVEVIAAAPGIIIDKHDGEFDRNCTGNNLTANYVIVQHADGSTALYWHLKSGSTTSIAIGGSVATGDHIGVVGSSGSSSGPHLHFEVWTGSTSASRNDPYAGTCNSLNANSWWAAQKPAKETGVIRASAHTTDIVLPPCPTTETLNEGPAFTIPFQGPGLPAGYAKFYIFIRDEIAGLNADLRIIDPFGGTYLSWTYASTSDNKVRTWGWSKVLPTISGTYTFEAVYNGETCSSTFDIVGIVGLEGKPLSNANVYPNPSNGNFVLELSDYAGDEFLVFDVFGKQVYNARIDQQPFLVHMDATCGMYFYQVKEKGQISAFGKLVIK